MADISKIDPNGLYLVIDKQTGEVVYRTTWKNRRRANSYADKRNLEYGAHRFNPRTAFESEIEPQTAPRKTAMATPLQKQLSPELLMTMRQAPAMEEAFSMYNERAAEVRRIQQELAERPSRSVRNMLLGQLEDAKGNLFNMQMILEKKASEIQARRALAAKQLDERVFSAMEEPRIEDEVFGREMETQRQERQVMRGEAARRGSARTGLSAMLESEGIPRESFIDFVETPENRRSGKSVPQLIQDYKIAGELPESAGVPRGRSPRSYPLQPMAAEERLEPGTYRQRTENQAWATYPEEPTLRPGTTIDEFGEIVSQESAILPEMTSQQKAFIAQDPESGLNIFTPTEVEAQWEGRPLSDDDLLMRGIDPQSPTGPQDEFNLMYGGDEGFDVEKGFKFEDESPPRSIKEITEDPRYFERFNEDPRYSLNRSAGISQRLAEIDEQISGLSTNPDNIAILDNALPGDPEAGKLMRKLDELSKERDYLRSWKQQTDQSSLARGMAPELLEGATLGMDPETGDFRPVTSSGERQMIVGGSNIPERQMVVPGQNMARPSSGGTEAAQGVLRGTAELEPDRVTMNVDRPVLRSTNGATAFDPTSAPRAGQIGPRLPLSQKFIGSAEQVRDILANPDIKAKIAPGKLSRLERFALKAGPLLHAAGNVALAAELGYFVGKERDLGGGLMAMGASNVEGTGALMQLPQAGVEAARSAFVPEELQDLPLPGEIATQGLAAAGRGLQSSVGAYRREEDRGDRRVHYERQKAFYRELEPTLSEDQIREMAMRDVSGASTQEAIDDLQRRVSDRDVMMDGFPAQSGMIAEGMRRRSLYPEGAGLATELITSDLPRRRLSATVPSNSPKRR